MYGLHPRTTVLAGILVVLAGSVLSRAQQPPPGPDGQLPPAAAAEPVTLPVNPAARKKLEAARDYIQTEEWHEVVRLLQGLIDAREDSFLQLRSDKGQGRESTNWVSVRGEVERLLAGLPPRGMDFYRLARETTARKMLRDAAGNQDLSQISEVTRCFRFTESGSAAFNLLGTYYLDRGRPDLAALCFDRLLEHPGPEKLSPLTLFKAALSFRSSGDRGRFQQAWQELTRRGGTDGVRLGTRLVKLDDLHTELDRWRGGLPAGDWLVYRGNAERSQLAHADTPLLEPRWRMGTAASESSRELLNQARQAALADVVSLPAAMPVVTGGQVIARSQAGLLAVNAETGKPLWHTGLSMSLESLLAEPGRKVQIEHWFRQYGFNRNLIYRNSILGTLSSDGMRVYAIDDLPLPPHPNLMMALESGGPRPAFSTLKDAIYHNKLAAVDVQTGRMVWKIGGRGSEAVEELSDAYFLGPPLPLGSSLFALVEKKQDLNLVCLGAEKGDVLWSQQLLSPRDKILLNTQRRTQALHLAYRDGYLFCPTHSGAVMTVDVLSRRLVWAQTYPTRINPLGDPGEAPLYEGPGHTWLDCPPLLQGDRIIVAPLDADAIFCLSVKNGEMLWKVERGPEDLYVGAVHEGAVLVVGRHGDRALSLTTGKQLWEQATPPPTAQGALAVDAAGKARYYLPLQSGDLLALSLERPAREGNAKGEGEAPAEPIRIARRSAQPLGNLVFHGSTLVSQSPGELTAFQAQRTLLAQLDEQLKTSADPRKLLEGAAEFRLDRGEAVLAVADLRRARDRLSGASDADSTALAWQVRQRLYEALSDLLQRDFPAAEPYLNEYRELCRARLEKEVAAEPSQRAQLVREERQRLIRLLALLARGREGQGRLLEALAHYRELHDQPNPEDLLPSPEEPAVSIRTDLWARQRVAGLFRNAAPDQQALLRQHLEREWRGLSGSAGEQAERWLDLFEQVAGDWPALRTARLEMMERWAGNRDRAKVLAVSRRLNQDPGEQAETPALKARALFAQARLLTNNGLLEDAAECYRRLAREHPGEVLPGGFTGAQLLEEVGTDKRLIASLDRPPAGWEGRAFRGSEGTTGLPLRSTVFAPVEQGGQGWLGQEPWQVPIQPDHRPPASCRNLRFLIDPSSSRLVAQARDTGLERWSIPLPVPVRMQNMGPIATFVLCDHLALLVLHQHLAAVDLAERRVLWSRRLVEGPLSSNPNVALDSFGGMIVPMPDGTVQRLGLVGPVSRAGIYLMTRSGLLALDPLTGQVRWQRSDMPRLCDLMGDDTHLFLMEYQGQVDSETGVPIPRAVRAFQARDGKALPIADATQALTNRRRLLGRCVLVSETDAKKRLVLRLYDLVAGKDLWKQTYPADSKLLDSQDAELIGVLQPDGLVALADLRAIRDGKPSRLPGQLALDRKHLLSARGGMLLHDAEQVYLALRSNPGNPALGLGPGLEDFSPHFQGELLPVLVDGYLYAFDRTTGARRWFLPQSSQFLLLNRFAELPLILGAVAITRQLDPNKPALQMTVLTSIDKRTGKVVYHHEVQGPPNDPYQTLLIDPRKGVIELLGMRSRWRHAAAGK